MRLFNVGRALFNGLPWSGIIARDNTANSVLCTDWDKRLTRAEKTGHFTEGDRDRAASWTRCCIGELRKQHECFMPTATGEHGGTDDDRLNSLGVHFTIAVRDANVKLARQHHTSIVERATALLRLKEVEV